MLHQTVTNLLVHVFEGGEEKAGLQRFFLHGDSEVSAKNKNDISCGGCHLLEKLMGLFCDSGGQESSDVNVRASGNATTAVEDATTTNNNLTNDGNDDNNDIEPRYGEVMLAMKTLYQLENNARTSDDCSDENAGNDSGAHNNNGDVGAATGAATEDEVLVADDGDVNNITPISEDDIDSVMAKERQESGGCGNDIESSGKEDMTIGTNSAKSKEDDTPFQAVKASG